MELHILAFREAKGITIPRFRSNLTMAIHGPHRSNRVRQRNATLPPATARFQTWSASPMTPQKDLSEVNYIYI